MQRISVDLPVPDGPMTAVMPPVAFDGSANDAYRVTDMHPEARGATRAITMALEDAEIEPREIGYVNAHGTSTLENDRAETLALKQAFGDAAPDVPVGDLLDNGRAARGGGGLA